MSLVVNPSENRPRLIIWEITCSCVLKNPSERHLTTQQCFSVLDSIAEISKPIIVLTSNYSYDNSCDPLDRPDIIDIILYGNSIGLKMIVETKGDKLTQDFRNVLRTIGTKCIRIVVDDKIKEDIENGYKKDAEFEDLNSLLDQLKSEGFEIQLGMNLKNFVEREVLFVVDFAVRKNAKGLYFHFKAEANKSKNYDNNDVIMWIAHQKRLLPDEMYFSPQCVKYGIKNVEDENEAPEIISKNPRITHWCLGGKTFAFINRAGQVQVCSSIKTVCGDLYKENFNFAKIWRNCEKFNLLRYYNFTCLQTQKNMNQPILKNTESKEMFEQA